METSTLENEGWTSLTTGGYSGLIGPFWTKGRDRQRILGLVVEGRHCNSHLKTVHGAVLVAVADVSLGMRVVDEIGAPRCATSQLNTHFVSTAPEGAFLTCQPELVKRGKELVFMRGLILHEEKVIAGVDGIWKILGA